ncbi:hypothetical protein [Arsenicicoccus bolidensis]|uniref:hypothetical protein n=1 Tax=Arsenicicoccus bolidensis TaxID=229480 RepID=UPI0028AA82D5|nr:hypothetical protein [Arsenicicoccus bolidensis]
MSDTIGAGVRVRYVDATGHEHSQSLSEVDEFSCGHTAASSIPHVWAQLACTHDWTVLRAALIHQADEISNATLPPSAQ